MYWNPTDSVPSATAALYCRWSAVQYQLIATTPSVGFQNTILVRREAKRLWCYSLTASETAYLDISKLCCLALKLPQATPQYNKQKNVCETTTSITVRFWPTDSILSATAALYCRWSAVQYQLIATTPSVGLQNTILNWREAKRIGAIPSGAEREACAERE